MNKEMESDSSAVEY